MQKQAWKAVMDILHHDNLYGSYNMSRAQHIIEDVKKMDDEVKIRIMEIFTEIKDHQLTECHSRSEKRTYEEHYKRCVRRYILGPNMELFKSRLPDLLV